MDANGNRFTKGQNNADYLTRRIARHHPNILERPPDASTRTLQGTGTAQGSSPPGTR